MYEDKQAICDAFLKTLLLTRAAGEGNRVKELRYIPEKEIIRPVFEDGSGEDGWYDVHVACDSGIAVVMDLVSQFVRIVW